MSVIPIRSPGHELSSWIDGFVEYTRVTQSPPLFRQWAAIVTIAAALERKVWIISQRRKVWPNLYVFIAGPPGSGKTRAVSEVEDFFLSLPDHKLAHTSLTKASLIDAIKEAERAIPGHPELGTFNCLMVACKELGALMPSYDPDFMHALTFMYDNEAYSEKRRSKDTDFTIKSPTLNLIACTTPSYLNETMHEGAWDQGFLSRVICVYDASVEISKLDLFEEGPGNDKDLAKALNKDIQSIGNRVGRLMFGSREAGEMLEAWNDARREHEPSHPRLTYYNQRRVMNLLKLCMIAAVDNGAPHIDVPHVQRAMNWLTEVEKVMPDIFLAMSSGGDARVINEAHHWLITHQVRENKPQTGANLRQYLSGRVPSHSVERVVDLMFRTGMIKAVGVDGVWAKPPS